MATYACTDLHGRYDLYLSIKKFLQQEDTVYFLGDAGDRGPDSWKLIKALLKDKQFIYLKGNHEDMLAAAMKDFITDEMMDYNHYVLCNNGGANTFMEWSLDEYRDSWYYVIKSLPTHAEYDNEQGFHIMLTHAGFTPNRYKMPKDEDLLWDRNHFCDEWPEDCANTVLIIHGHTPIPHLAKRLGVDYEPGAFWYCNDHKVCLDTGAYATNYTCLLDLDTFDEHIFQIEGE